MTMIYRVTRELFKDEINLNSAEAKIGPKGHAKLSARTKEFGFAALLPPGDFDLTPAEAIARYVRARHAMIESAERQIATQHRLLEAARALAAKHGVQLDETKAAAATPKKGA
jgi:hypothetical protein